MKGAAREGGVTMATSMRVTVTLPADLVAGIDRYDQNRSRFVSAAVQRELVRRRRVGLLQSLESPHPETSGLAETGVSEWSASLRADDADLVDPAAGRPVRWVEGKGWLAGNRGRVIRRSRVSP